MPAQPHLGGDPHPTLPVAASLPASATGHTVQALPSLTPLLSQTAGAGSILPQGGVSTSPISGGSFSAGADDHKYHVLNLAVSGM